MWVSCCIRPVHVVTIYHPFKKQNRHGCLATVRKLSIEVEVRRATVLLLGLNRVPFCEYLSPSYD